MKRYDILRLSCCLRLIFPCIGFPHGLALKAWMKREVTTRGNPKVMIIKVSSSLWASRRTGIHCHHPPVGLSLSIDPRFSGPSYAISYSPPVSSLRVPFRRGGNGIRRRDQPIESSFLTWIQPDGRQVNGNQMRDLQTEPCLQGLITPYHWYLWNGLSWDWMT